MPIRSVAIVAIPGVQPFELGVAWEGFGIDRTDEGVPAYDCFVVSEKRVGADRGRLHDLDAAPARQGGATPTSSSSRPRSTATRHCEPVLDLLRETVERGARVMSVCSGAFTLGAAGLLDGRDCTTHWRYADELAGAVPGRARQPGRAVRLRRPGAHLGRHGRRARPVPAPDPRRPRRGGRAPGRAPHGHAAAPRRRPGAVRRRADPDASGRHAGAAARRAEHASCRTSTPPSRWPSGWR